MEGVVQWAALIFVSAIALGAIAVAWKARDFIAALQIKYELAIADLVKDVRHLKGNLAQHAVNYTEMHDDQIRLKAEVDRLTKIVNGKH
jgi:hypothetical protein